MRIIFVRNDACRYAVNQAKVISCENFTPPHVVPKIANIEFVTIIWARRLLSTDGHSSPRSFITREEKMRECLCRSEIETHLFFYRHKNFAKEDLKQ